MKLSAVVQLIDGFNGAPAVGIQPAFLLDGRRYWPHPKTDGFYAFSELAEGSHRLTAMALAFFTQEVELTVPVSLPLAAAIVPCVLAPGPLYPFPPGTTLIRGQVLDAATRNPLAGVDVELRYAALRGGTRNSSTQTSGYGRYDGRYALAARGKLAAHTEATLIFSKTGYASAQTQLTLEPATTQFVDIEMR